MFKEKDFGEADYGWRKVCHLFNLLFHEIITTKNMALIVDMSARIVR